MEMLNNKTNNMKKEYTPFKMKNANSPAKCWKTHKKVGMKKSPTRPGKMVNDCVRK